MTELAVAAVNSGATPHQAIAESFSDDAVASTPPAQVISFAIGDDQYGVDIMAVREIKGWTDMTALPGQAEYVRGVLNLRGVIVPIVDLRCRFGQGVTTAGALHIVIIVQIGAKQTGLLADRVLDIVSLDDTQIKPVPRVAQSQKASFLSGLLTTETGMIALIDLHHLLSENTVEEKSANDQVLAAA
jgi:purine-binding chemotaxis protein CheW